MTDIDGVQACRRVGVVSVDGVTVMLEDRSNDDEESVPAQKPEDRMLKWFVYSHLPERLQNVSKAFHDLAIGVVRNIPSGPERTVSLRKLLESKDAAVRAVVHPGE